MNYYPFHIGDYLSATRHLSWEEDAAFRRLLDTYYTTEKPIPADHRSACRLVLATTDSQREAVKTVLEEFFTLTDAGWINSRADEEIEAMREKQQKQRDRANKRWHKPEAERGNAPAMPRHNEIDATASKNDANAMPPTPTPTPLFKEDSNESLSPAPKALADCPHKALVALWAKHLPHLPQPRSWEGNRVALMRSRWCQASKRSDYSPEGYATEAEGLAWWDGFFAHIAQGTTLAAGFESEGRRWVPDLPWVLKAENFQKIIDGKYEK